MATGLPVIFYLRDIKMSKTRTKRYNPRKYLNTRISPFELLPILSPLDTLSDLLARGYLTDREVRVNGEIIDTEYSLLVFCFQHAFIIEAIKDKAGDPIFRYTKSIKECIKSYFVGLIHDSEVSDTGMTIVPLKKIIGTIAQAKLLYFIRESKKCLYGITVRDYQAALRSGANNFSLYIAFHPDMPLCSFLDGEGNNEILKFLNRSVA